MRVKRYDERILGLLLDRYEGSLLYTGKNQVNISISVKLNKSVIPEYFDQTSTEYTVIEQQLRDLAQTGLIRIIYGKTHKHIIESVELAVDEAQQAYTLLHRVPKSAKESRLSEMLARIGGTSSSDTVRMYISYIAQRLQEGKSVRAEVDVDDPQELEAVCRLIDSIEDNADEIFLRELSVRTFHDSKTAEHYLTKAVGVLRRFSRRLQSLTAAADMTNEEILEEYNVYKNPSWVMIKGSGKLYIADGLKSVSVQGSRDGHQNDNELQSDSNQKDGNTRENGCCQMYDAGNENNGTRVNIRCLPMGLGVAGADVDKLVWDVDAAPRRVLTIENLTTFHRWKDVDGDTLGIYLGGYANGYRRNLIKRIHAAYPDAEYVHFGDIDCGGFCIWKALCEETGIGFKTFSMDLETYLLYCDDGRPLTDGDRRKLEKMKEDGFFAQQRELFEEMLSRGMKVEQEGIGL